MTFLFVWLALSLWVIFAHGVAASNDMDHDGLLDSKEKGLALKYAPVLHFAAGERFFPTNISYHLNNSVLKQRTKEGYKEITASPTIGNLSYYWEGDYYLDNALGGLEEIAEDYSQKRDRIGYLTYAHVTKDSDHLVVQYWFFYAFNNGPLGHHEGDWEMIEIILNSFEEPLYAVYSQHLVGEKASWNDVEKLDGSHPSVYVALGSHANYFRPYQGRMVLENDVLGSAFTLLPDDLEIVLLGEQGVGNHPESQAWLRFSGRWGDWAEPDDILREKADPRGPGHHENYVKWHNPVSWGMSAFLVNNNWFVLSWIAYYFLYIFSGIIAPIALLKARRITKLKRRGELNIKAIMLSKASLSIFVGTIGMLLYLVAFILPWYVVKVNIQTEAISIQEETILLNIDGINGAQINTLESDKGFVRLFSLQTPLAVILFTTIMFNILDIIGIGATRNLVKKYITSGITSVIPVILILIFVAKMSGLIPQYASAITGGTAPPEINQIADSISSSPVQGRYDGSLGTYGAIFVSWGLGTGSYLFIAAALVKLAAGIVAKKIVVDVVL